MNVLLLILSIVLTAIAVYDIKEYLQKSVRRVSILPIIAMVCWVLWYMSTFQGLFSQ